MGLNGPRSDGFLLFLKPTSQPLWQTDLIRALLKNPDFRALFVERLEYQMTYIWNKDRVNAAIDHFAEMIGKWNGTTSAGWVTINAGPAGSTASTSTPTGGRHT